MKAKFGAVRGKKKTKLNKNNVSRSRKTSCFVLKPLNGGRSEKITREAEMKMFQFANKKKRSRFLTVVLDKRIPGSLIHSSVIKNVAFREDVLDF